MSNWFAMGVNYGGFQDQDAEPVWSIFRDHQIACNGYARGSRTDIDAILDEIKYGDYIILKGFSPNTGICVYGIGEVIGMNTYPFPIPDNYKNQCIKLNWILRSVDDRYVEKFPSLVGKPYSDQLFKLPSKAIYDISDWLKGIGIRV